MREEEESAPWLDGIKGDALPLLIRTDAKVVRVVAGPGSGKTLGLKRRVQRLIQGKRVNPEKIFVGTFTRAIAVELADALGVSVRIDELGKENGNNSVQLSTLHSHALRLVRLNPTARPGRSLRFLLEYEKEAMLYDIGEVIADPPKQAGRKRELKRVCAAWAEGKNLEIAGFVGEMDRWLRRHGGMLIDEVVNLARMGLESGDILAGQFDHVIIDEYQDLTEAEQHLVEGIWSTRGSLVVLGDDDQSIYSFRDCHPGGITEFAKRWDERLFADVGIPDNRRCGRVIVDLANAMMAEAGSTKPPMISTQENEGGENEGDVSLVYWQSVAHEIGGLARYIQQRRDTRFLVLVPRRFIGYRLKERIGPDALTSFHEEVLEVPIVQERFALACLVANLSDRVALRTVLGFHANGVEQGAKRNANAYACISQSDLDVQALLEAIVSGDLSVTGTGCNHLRTRAATALEFLQHLSEDPVEVIDTLFDPSLANAVADEETKEKAKRDLEHLRDSAKTILAANREEELVKILDQLRYRIAMRVPLTEPTEARVRIMTLHGAKGLEADAVIVAGVADQIIPGYASANPIEAISQREEQRRLLYVSVTRAKRELVISWSQRMLYEDASRNRVRLDGGVITIGDQKFVKLGRTTLLPDIPELPQTGLKWLRTKLE